MRKIIVPIELAKTTTQRRLAPPSSGKSRLPRPRRPLSRPKMMMPTMIVPPPWSRNHHHLSPRKIPLSSRDSSSRRCDSFCSNFFVGCPRQTARKNLLLCSTATSHSSSSAPPLLERRWWYSIYIRKGVCARSLCSNEEGFRRERTCALHTEGREREKEERIWCRSLNPKFKCLFFDCLGFLTKKKYPPLCHVCINGFKKKDSQFLSLFCEEFIIYKRYIRSLRDI